MKNSKITKDGYKIFAEVLKKYPDFFLLRYYVSDKGIPMDIEIPRTDKNEHFKEGDNIQLALLVIPDDN